MPIYRITEEHKWNLLLVSLRAHGKSGGNISTLGVLERYDCCDWANWVASEFGEQVPIYLMGISMGGAAVLMSSDLNLPKSVCGIIDDAGFTTPLEMIKVGSKNKLRYELLSDIFTQMVNVGTKIWGHFDLKDADASVAVSKTNVPILIIHGDKDNRAPLSMAYKIYDSCQGEKDLYIVSGATHKECYRTNPEKYEKIVSEFIEKIFRDKQLCVFEDLSAMCSATWLCCSSVLPLRGEQQATDYNPATAYIRQFTLWMRKSYNGKVFWNRWLPWRSWDHADRRPCLQGGAFPRLVLQRIARA